MQASASVVLPTASTLLSQLKAVRSGEDESKTADATESPTNQKIVELYHEIKQQDSENILNGDDESGWGAQVAAEIRCSLCAWPIRGSRHLISYCFQLCRPPCNELPYDLPGSMSLRLQIPNQCAQHHLVSLFSQRPSQTTGLHRPALAEVMSVTLERYTAVMWLS